MVIETIFSEYKTEVLAIRRRWHIVFLFYHTFQVLQIFTRETYITYVSVWIVGFEPTAS